jgi:GT2 family glycosyltransferase
MNVSIIIPVAGAHAKLVGSAIQSCLWQSYPNVEVIVVNDGSEPIGPYADPRVHVVDSPNRHAIEPRGNRAAVARNAGVQVATGEYVVFLDADDYLLPDGIEILLRGDASHNHAYTYSSHYTQDGTHLRPPEYAQEKYKTFNIHPITCLIPTSAVRAVGGFDERAPGWEDWTLYLRLAIAGYCGKYVRGPVFVYRDQHSINHLQDVAAGQSLMDRVIAPYTHKGEITMATCCGGSKKQVQQIVNAMPSIPVAPDGTQTLEFTGNMIGTSTYRHPVSKRVYKAGAAASVRYLIVPAEDVAYLISLGIFRIIKPPTPMVSAPDSAALAEVVEDVVVIEPESVDEIIASEPESDVVVDDTTTKRRGRPKSNG